MKGAEPANGSYEQDGGYIMLTGIYDHPLSSKNGALAEHRKVLFEKIGPGQHGCHWCGKVVEWPIDLYADHVDSDITHNEQDNLVPSCLRCNWGRKRVY